MTLNDNDAGDRGALLPSAIADLAQALDGRVQPQLDAPLLSVVTPTYNAMLHFGETAKSVAMLAFPFEWIIVDDCSTDGTLDYIEHLRRLDHRIKLLRNRSRTGKPWMNYRHGLEAARGQYVLFLDHDDVTIAGTVSEAIRRLTLSGLQLAIMKVAYMDEASQIYKTKFIPWTTYDRRMSGLKLFWTIVLSPTYPLKQGAVIINRHLLQSIGHPVVDIELVLAACQRTDALLIDAVGLNYRNIRSSMSSSVALRLQDSEKFWFGYIDRNIPPSWRHLAPFLKAYRWLLGWPKLLYLCISAKRV